MLQTAKTSTIMKHTRYPEKYRRIFTDKILRYFRSKAKALASIPFFQLKTIIGLF